MSLTTKFCQNALMCAAAVGTAALYGCNYFGEEILDMVPAVVEKFLVTDLFKWSLIGATGAATAATFCFFLYNAKARKKETEAMADSIGENLLPEDQWKNIPQVY